MGLLFKTEVSTVKESSPLLTPEQLTYKSLIKHIALNVIRQNHATFRDNLSWLQDSPLPLVAPHIEDIETNQNMTAIKTSPMSKEGDELFEIAFKQFCKLAHVDEKFVSASLTKIGLNLIKKTLVRPTTKASASFEAIFHSDHEKVLSHTIPTENSITEASGVHWQNCEWRLDKKEESAHKLQLALATSLAYFLRNQATMAGHIDHQVPSSDDKKYAQHVRKTYFSPIPNSHPPQLTINWDILAPGPLGAELKKTLPTLPEFADHDVSDMTAYYPIGETKPKTLHPDFIHSGIKALKVLLLHPNGRQYLTIPVNDVLSMGSTKLAELLILPTTTQEPLWSWQSNDQLSDGHSAHNHPFAIRMDYLTSQHKILSFEKNITNFLSLSCDSRSQRSKLEWRSGHFPSDGSIRNDALGTFSQLIEGDIIPGDTDFVQILPSPERPCSMEDIQKAKSLTDLLGKLKLGKIIIGTRYDSTALDRMVRDYNKKYLIPQDLEIKNLIIDKKEGVAIKAQISSLLHKFENILDSKQPPPKDGGDPIKQRQNDVIAQIGAVLNPHLASIDALAIASENTCASATCALPYSKLRRLVTYASDHINKTVRPIRESFKLTSTERVLARLGLGWQSILSITVKGQENLSKQSAKTFATKLVSASLALRQLSDQGRGKNTNYFITALSAKIDELAAAIGVAGDYLTERVDLEKPDFIAALPLSTAFTESDINFFAKIWGRDQEATLNRLRNINTIILSTKGQSDPSTILKKIAELEPDHPQDITRLFLATLLYRELNHIPIHAISYVNQGIFGH